MSNLSFTLQDLDGLHETPIMVEGVKKKSNDIFSKTKGVSQKGKKSGKVTGQEKQMAFDHNKVTNP